jgi:gas vesicle protein
MKTDKVILGVLGGLAAGAIMGILFAPEKEKTRRKIRNTSNDYADELKDKFDDALENLYKKYDVPKKTGKVFNEGKSKFEKKKDIENIDIKISVSKISIIKIHLA